MKNYKIFNLLALVLLLFASAACSKDDLVFTMSCPSSPQRKALIFLR